MLSKYVSGVEFRGDFAVSSKDIIRTREAVIETIKKELPHGSSKIRCYSIFVRGFERNGRNNKVGFIDAFT